MDFLKSLLQRSNGEKLYLLISIGYLAEDVWVPELKRKELAEVAVWMLKLFQKPMLL